MIPLMLAKQGLSLGLGMVQFGLFRCLFLCGDTWPVLASKVIIAAVVHFVPPMVRIDCSCSCSVA